MRQRLRPQFQDLGDVGIALKQRNRFLPGNPRDRRVRMDLGERRQERRRSQHVAHRVQLHDEEALLDAIVVIARAEQLVALVPDAGAVPQKKPAVPRDLAGTGGLPGVPDVNPLHDTLEAAPVDCRSPSRRDVESPGIRPTM